MQLEEWSMSTAGIIAMMLHWAVELKTDGKDKAKEQLGAFLSVGMANDVKFMFMQREPAVKPKDALPIDICMADGVAQISGGIIEAEAVLPVFPALKKQPFRSCPINT